MLCFNDDIQGTGAVCVAGVLGALRIQQKPAEAIKDLKIVVVGAGSAGIGVAGALRSAMIQAGASEEEIAKQLKQAPLHLSGTQVITCHTTCSHLCDVVTVMAGV